MTTLTLVENLNANDNTMTPVIPGIDEFHQLLEELRPSIFHYCQRYLRNQDDAEEACQETMVKALLAWSNFEGRSSVKTWLYRIASNECANLYRQRGRYELHEELEAETESDEFADASSDECLFSQFMNKLNLQERNVLSFRFLEDMQLPEIATCLDMKISAVKMCYYRALDKFPMVAVS